MKKGDYMKCEVLIATMNNSNCEKLLSNMNVKNAVLINQITNDNVEMTNINDDLHNIISVKDRGLSKSRNLAIKNSTADICLIADDDMFYYDDYEEKVLAAYSDFPDADMIAFVVTHDNRKTKKILREGKVGFLNSNKIQSVQLSFKRKSIIDAGIKFDELFGAGSVYNFGEENIFMTDCRKAGLKLYFKPIVIANLYDTGQSTWFNGYNERYFINRGAIFKRMTKLFYPVLIIQFAIRKYKLYRKEMNIIKALRLMFIGAKKI